VPSDDTGPPSGGGSPDTWVSAFGADPDESISKPRRRRRRVLAITAAVVVGVAAVGVVASTSLSKSSSTSSGVVGGPAEASRLVRSSLAAATAATTFHYVSVSTSQGITQKTIGDAAPDRGRQVITIGSTEDFAILVVGTVAYFQGNAASMEDQLGLDAVVAQRHAGQWISLQPSDSPYHSVYQAVTTASALSDSVTIAARARLAPTTVAGTTVTPIRGALTAVDQTPTRGTARLDIRAKGPPLPVAFTASGVVSGQATTFRTDFSQWGESVVVEPPPGALAYSSADIGGLNQNGNPTILT
jgi:hypothetical protein